MSARSRSRLRGGLLAALLAAAGALAVWTAGASPPAPLAPGTFAFAATGDSPYLPWEEAQYHLVLRDIRGHDLAWVLHVGDLFWRPCSDERYAQQLEWFNSLPQPVIYTPGDNEWTDCWRRLSGAYAPLDRLRRIREIFFRDPRRSLGGRPMALQTQADQKAFAEFVEHARWTHQGLVFATLHIVGSANAGEPFVGRGAADDDAVRRRREAAIAWLRETFGVARATGMTGVVLAFHASMGFDQTAGTKGRRAFDAIIAALADEADRFGGPVLVIHGDGHQSIVDHPLRSPAGGRRLGDVTRLEVPGSPKVGWVRVVVTPGPRPTFSFEPRIVPLWKYW